MTQLVLIPERIPYIVIMHTYNTLDSEYGQIRKRVQDKLYNGTSPKLDLKLHKFVVTFNQEHLANNPGIIYKRYYSNFLCACRTLVYNSYFGGFICNMETGKVTNVEQAFEEVRKCPYG